MKNFLHILSRKGECFVALAEDALRGAERDMRIAVAIEKGKDGKYTSYCDELNCVADGDTEEEALNNLLDCVHVLMAEYGDLVRARLKDRRYHLINV